MNEILNVWSCGGGVQSAAIAALICRGRLPKPDISLMVDTGREKETTWEYVHGTLIPNLRNVGVELVIVKTSDYATVDLYSSKGDLLLPVFTGDGKMPTFCSNEWKSRVCHRYLRTLGVEKCRTWIGISADEMNRARVSRLAWNQNCYPFLEAEFKLYYRRHDCVEEVRRAGWGDAPRSSCFMCSNQSDAEWAAMTQADLERAAILEDAIRERDSGFFLHKSRVPLREATFDDSAGAMPGGCEGMCFV
jgi:hypothetical protein